MHNVISRRSPVIQFQRYRKQILLTSAEEPIPNQRLYVLVCVVVIELGVYHELRRRSKYEATKSKGHRSRSVKSAAVEKQKGNG